MTTRARLVATACVAALVGLTASPAATAALLGPSAYSGSADSPFAPFAGFGYFHLEDFDDHALNTPGVSVTPGTTSSALTGFNGSIIDQVGLAGGCAPGGLAVACDTWFGNGPTGLTFTFDANVLGQLPNAVGLVWTDGAGTISFEAFDENGISIGILVGNHADGSFFGTIGDDRFYGATNAGGISRIHISNTSGGIEVDHLQYGFRALVNVIPEPASPVLVALGAWLAWLARRRGLVRMA